MGHKKLVFVGVILSVFLAGCGLLLPGINSRPRNNFESNGASIYYTGRTLDGDFIEYTGRGFEGMMMNQQLSCSSCHGQNGSGGNHVMHMQIMDAPDIRYSALSSDIHEDEDDHDEGHDGYDLHTFERAVVSGEHPDGDSLSNEMPRWQLSEQDLEDLFDFIQTLD